METNEMQIIARAYAEKLTAEVKIVEMTIPGAAQGGLRSQLIQMLSSQQEETIPEPIDTPTIPVIPMEPTEESHQPETIPSTSPSSPSAPTIPTCPSGTSNTLFCMGPTISNEKNCFKRLSAISEGRFYQITKYENDFCYFEFASSIKLTELTNNIEKNMPGDLVTWKGVPSTATNVRTITKGEGYYDGKKMMITKPLEVEFS